MIIDEQFRQCVVYLYVERDTDEEPGVVRRHPHGTAFWVSMPLGGLDEGESGAFLYLVTAGHVALRARKYKTVFVRFNMEDGTYCDVPTSAEGDWHQHPDPRTDIALARLNAPLGAEYTSVPINLFVTDQFATDRRISPGDELFSVSLFAPHPGKQRMEPICIFGDICMMPQPISMKLLGPSYPPSEFDAYLTEWRSWGGMSGSPVFIYFPQYRDPREFHVGLVTPVQLLGLVQGHMNIPQEVDLTSETIDSPGTAMIQANSGVTAVIPSQKIADFLMLDEFAEARQRSLEEIRRNRPAGTPD